ncbi:MAG: tetraacyldisaccharide 4'-kinase [Nitrospira sp.]|nr:tetraacyldisaccharide 4'-kinase [Nitrospira sp.]
MTIFEHLYYLGYLIDKYFALKRQKKLPCKVISIGNITAGGTGKTPATIAMAEEAQKRGFKPCILTRGYRGKAKGPCFVKDSYTPIRPSPIKGEGKGGGVVHHATWYLFGDEPVLMAERLKDVPIVKGTDRYNSGLFAIENLRSQISDLKSLLFILDDGFQHYELFRDRNILLINGTNPFGNRRLLPLGLLREPLSEIKRADVIVITKTEVPPTQPSPSRGEGKGGGVRSQGSGFRIQDSRLKSLIEEIKRFNSKAPIFFAEHTPSKLRTIHGDSLSLEWAKGKRLFGFCGIGNPESFRITLLSAGIELAGFKTYGDHYRYTLDDRETIIKNAKECGADWIVTTEKDIMRLKGLELPENLVALVIEFRVDEGFYEEVF